MIRVLTHSIVELRYDALVKSVMEPQVGRALQKTYLPKSKGKTRGRPKGSKNKKKKKKPKKRNPKKRGPKTPKSPGKQIELNMTTNLVDVKYSDPSIVIDHSRKDNPPVPPISVVQELIWIAFCVFKGGYMVSSLIESNNSVIRHVMPDRGLRSESHLKNQLKPRLEYHSERPSNNDIIMDPRIISLPIRGSIGFYNLDKFLTPNLKNISISSFP